MMMTSDWIECAYNTEFNVRNFFDGGYTDISIGESLIDKYSPRDGSLLYQLGSGSIADVNMAVSSARDAFDDGRWHCLPVSRRKEVLHNLADLVAARCEELALYESLDVGKPITYALKDDIPSIITRLRSCADMVDKLFMPSSSDGSNITFMVRKPIGIVGAIVGWNYPLSLAATKVAPALVMGNSVVLKPSEFSSLSASRFAELAIEAGVPSGVFNVVHGAGHSVGSLVLQSG